MSMIAGPHNVLATAAGGAYAKGRLRMDVTKWGAADPEKLPWVDIAYIGVPMGQLAPMAVFIFSSKQQGEF